MRSAPALAVFSLGAILAGCSHPAHQPAPVPMSASQLVLAGGDTTGLRRLLAQLDDTLGANDVRGALSAEADALLRTLDDSTFTRLAETQMPAELEAQLQTSGDSAFAQLENTPMMAELEALLREGNQTGSAGALPQQNSVLDSLWASLRCVSPSSGDTAGRVRHP